MSIMTTEELGAGSATTLPRASSFTFDAQDITGMHNFEARNVQPATPAGAVARALANQLSLPANVPWTLRNDRSGDYLEESRAIGEQIPESGAKLTIVPKTHLGRLAFRQ